MEKAWRILVLIMVSMAVDESSSGAVIGVPGGMDPPPPMLGPYEMTPFELDDRPLFEEVFWVSSPLGGQVDFSPGLLHRRVGYGWAFWGHDYEGDVYSTLGVTEIVLELPDDAMAFYFYANQNLDHTEPVTAQTDDGTWLVQQTAFGVGAVYFGFYQDDPAGPPIDFITVSCPATLAVGEFAIAIPAPGLLAMLGVAGIGAGLRRRRG